MYWIKQFIKQNINYYNKFLFQDYKIFLLLTKGPVYNMHLCMSIVNFYIYGNWLYKYKGLSIFILTVTFIFDKEVLFL